MTKTPQIGGASIEIATATAAFWRETGAHYRAGARSAATEGATRAALKTRVAWVGAAFLLIYVGTLSDSKAILVMIFLIRFLGIEVSLGGWLVNFMIEMRSGGEFASGLVATG